MPAGERARRDVSQRQRDAALGEGQPQLALARQVIVFSGARGKAKTIVKAWIEGHKTAVEPTELLLTELWATEVNDLSMIAVASRQIRTMTETRPR